MEKDKNDSSVGKLRNYRTPTGGLLSPLITNSIAVIVTIIWASSFIADIAMDEYQPPTSIHVAFMVVLGSVFGLQLVGGRDK